MGFLTGFLDNVSLLILVAALLWLSCNLYTKENPNTICQVYGYKISEGAIAQGRLYIEKLEKENAKLRKDLEELKNQEERQSKDELNKIERAAIKSESIED